MYGTVSRMKVKPGMEQSLLEIASRDVPGIVFEHVYKLDSGNDEYIMVVGFESKEAYVANANSPEMHEMYLEYRAFLQSDPEWNDGEIIHSQVK